MPLSHTFTSTASPGEASATFFLRDKQKADWTAVGTIDALCAVTLQIKVGSVWVDVRRFAAGSINASGSIQADNGNREYRWLAEVPLTDPVTVLTSFVATITDQTNVSQNINNPSGTRVLAITDNGIESPSVTATTGTIGSVGLASGTVTLAGGSVQHANGTAAGSIAEGFGTTAAEGLQTVILEETVSFVGNVALYKALTASLPANAVVLSAQANIQSALTGGGTTVKLGLGTAADPDVYGLSSALTKNTKIDHVPAAYALIGSTTALRLSSCATGGTAGDTALTVGSVRVRIVYRAPVSLINAA